MDTYQSIYGHRDINSAAVTTGKAISHMGIRGRTESTGLGVYYCAKEILANAHQASKLGVSTGLKGKTFILQGFGNVGYWLAKFFVQEGAILVGVAEVDGSIYYPKGIDPEQLLNFKKERNRINGYVQDGQHVEYFTDESAIYKEWYFSNNVAISSFQLPSKSQSTETTPISSTVSLSLRLPMDLPPSKLKKSYFQEESNSCQMFSVTLVVSLSATSNGWRIWTTSDGEDYWEK